MLPEGVGVFKAPQLLVNSIGRAAIRPINDRFINSWIANIENRVTTKGKYPKVDVLYSPFSPPPVFWDYKCVKCLWWQEPQSCKVVEGDISPRGWCAIWVPPAEYPALSWPEELVRGDW